MPFFAEDNWIILPPNPEISRNPIPLIFSLEGITHSFSPARGPLYLWAYNFYATIGNGVLWIYKLLNLIIFGITLFLLFQWFRKDNNPLFGLFGLFFFAFSFPVWAIVVAHSSAPGATMTILTSIAFYSTFFYYNYKKTESTLKLFLVLLLILFFVRLSSSLKGEARLLFPIMFLYLFFESTYLFIKQRRIMNGKITYLSFLKSTPLFQIKNIILLFFLFLLCIPVLQVINNFNDSSEYVNKTSIIYDYVRVLYSLRSSYPGEGFIHTNYNFYYHLFLEMLVTLRPFGFIALAFVFLSFIILLYHTNYSKTEIISPNFSDSANLCFFSGLWFILVFLAIISQRGFNYHTSFHWVLIDFYPAMFSFTIFFCTLMKLTYSAILNFHRDLLKKVFFCFLFVLLLIKFLFLLHWSGLYLDYHVGFEDTSLYLFHEYPNATVIYFHNGVIGDGSQLIPPYLFPKKIIFREFPENCFFLGERTISATPGSNLSFRENDTIFLVSNIPMNNTCYALRLSMMRTPYNDTLYYKIKNSLAISKETYVYTINTTVRENTY